MHILYIYYIFSSFFYQPQDGSGSGDVEISKDIPKKIPNVNPVDKDVNYEISAEADTPDHQPDDKQPVHHNQDTTTRVVTYKPEKSTKSSLISSANTLTVTYSVLVFAFSLPFLLKSVL